MSNLENKQIFHLFVDFPGSNRVVAAWRGSHPGVGSEPSPRGAEPCTRGAHRFITRTQYRVRPPPALCLITLHFSVASLTGKQAVCKTIVLALLDKFLSFFVIADFSVPILMSCILFIDMEIRPIVPRSTWLAFYPWTHWQRVRYKKVDILIIFVELVSEFGKWNLIEQLIVCATTILVQRWMVDNMDSSIVPVCLVDLCACSQRSKKIFKRKIKICKNRCLIDDNIMSRTAPSVLRSEFEFITESG